MEERKLPDLEPAQARQLLETWRTAHEQEIAIAKMRLRVAHAMGGETEKAEKQVQKEVIERNLLALDEIEKMLGELQPKA